MIETTHPALVQCKSDCTLWRYMSLTKFDALLTQKKLFFCRSDKFADPFEGSTPKREAVYRIQEALKLSRAMGNPMTYKEAVETSERTSDYHQRLRRAFVVNCWHMNASESEAMWRLYLNNNEGVAVESTYSKLLAAIGHEGKTVYASRVRYIDYERDIWYHAEEYPLERYNVISNIVHKRQEYSHENELRIFMEIHDATNDEHYWDNQQTNKGTSLDCDVEKLIQRVIVHPTAGSDIVETIKMMLLENGLDIPVHQSSLDKTPVY